MSFLAEIQFKRYWVVCQKCGECVSRDQAEDDGWLIYPHRECEDFLVIRCYKHITEHALRQTRRGRTSRARRFKKFGLLRYQAEQASGVRELDPYKKPFPLRDEDPNVIIRNIAPFPGFHEQHWRPGRNGELAWLLKE